MFDRDAGVVLNWQPVTDRIS
ncbi:protein of unknown function [Azospirillum baldaniorum]|uniref:Uncharacterized protein n=1 Tax=Azospirillum baldaniorum TaxID=1064539 RepID=A0A9P1JNS4_9PROT|nr:protein of unknown function [Azospirillum baldaniorum]